MTFTCQILVTLPIVFPHGSILGPMLFLLYINDMISAVNCNLLLYADDSALMVSGDDVDQVESVLNQELYNVSSWLVDNKLSLHLGKSECILFGTRLKVSKSRDLNIICNGVTIANKSSVKYLGCEIDQSLTGEAMARKVIRKVNCKTKFLARTSKYLDIDTLKMLANALVLCDFDYASTAWFCGLGKTYQKKLQISQNKVIRTVLKLSPRTHISYHHFKSINWLPVERRVTMLRLCWVHSILNNSSTSYLSSHFIPVRNAHSVRTRASQMALYVPRVRSNIGKQSFRYIGAVIWNQLSHNLQNISSHSTFKRCLKKHLIN